MRKILVQQRFFVKSTRIPFAPMAELAEQRHWKNQGIG